MNLLNLLPASDSVGTIRTKKPTLYVFSGGNEDAAFFTTNSFSILLDGGDEEVPPYWNLIRNYDKVSAVLTTRISSDSLRGISSILSRKAIEPCHPNIGAFLGNLPARVSIGNERDIEKMVRAIYEGLQAEDLKPIEALANSKMEPITLYEVVGEGALRMIVLNPERGSKELSALSVAMKTGENVEKLAVAACLAVLLVWHPSDPSKPTIRILYPGACPLEKLYAALEKLKGEEYLHHVEYIVANREKYASNMSLNTRPGHAAPPPRGPANHKPIPAARNGTAAAAAHKPAAAKPPIAGAMRSIPKAAAPAAARPAKSPIGTGEAQVKKVTRQPLSGAMQSHVAPTKKPVVSTKSPDIGSKTAAGGKPQTPKAAPPRKGSGTPTAKPKDGSVASGGPKPNDSKKADLISSGDKTKVDAVKSPEEPEIPPPAEKPKTPPPAPQVPGKTGLLDDIEEPMKVRRVSMDTTGDGEKGSGVPSGTVEEDKDVSEVPENASIDVGKSALTSSLDSKTLETSQTSSSVKQTDSEDGSPLKPSKDLSDLAFGAPTSPSKISWDSETSPVVTGFAMALGDVLAADRKPTEQLLGNADAFDPFSSNAGAKEGEYIMKVSEQVIETVEKTGEQMPIPADVDDLLKMGSEVNAEAFGNNFDQNISSDSVNAHADIALDDVIERLAGESEQEDIPKVVPPAQAEDHHKVEHIKENGNTDPLTEQNLAEDAHAHEQLLPPMVRARPGRPSAVGAVAKPKLSQPLYFDVVFVPHHGAEAALQDEAAAKAFALSVRSKRYVISGKDAIKTHILDGFISAKTVWNKPELVIEVLPTHSSEMLSAYNQLKAGDMSEAGINLRSSVDRCTLRLTTGDADDCCAAYKFEMW